MKDVILKLRQFRDERDWKQFHNPKDLSLALSIEASELLEVFLWKSSFSLITLFQRMNNWKLE